MRLENGFIPTIKNRETLHTLGITSLRPYNSILEGSKFFALVRMLDNYKADKDGFKWIKIEGSHLVDFLGVQIVKFKNGNYSVAYKYATELKEA